MGSNSIENLLVVEPLSDGTFRLTKDYIYKDVTVPCGYKTNGMDLKLRILNLFVYRYDPRCLPAVVIHDFLCDAEEYYKADKYFEEKLPNIWQKKYMVLLVKIYHKIRY